MRAASNVEKDVRTPSKFKFAPSYWEIAKHCAILVEGMIAGPLVIGFALQLVG